MGDQVYVNINVTIQGNNYSYTGPPNLQSQSNQSIIGMYKLDQLVKCQRSVFTGVCSGGSPIYTVVITFTPKTDSTGNQYYIASGTVVGNPTPNSYCGTAEYSGIPDYLMAASPVTIGCL